MDDEPDKSGWFRWGMDGCWLEKKRVEVVEI